MKENPILLVEDDAVDKLSVQRAFKKLHILNKLYIAENGVEALKMLRGDGMAKLDPTPQIILLDLNMPIMGGIEFLLQMRDDPELHSIEVIVLTTSNWYNDKIKAFDLGISGYIVKPVTQSNLIMAIQTTQEAYWLRGELTFP